MWSSLSLRNQRIVPIKSARVVRCLRIPFALTIEEHRDPHPFLRRLATLAIVGIWLGGQTHNPNIDYGFLLMVENDQWTSVSGNQSIMEPACDPTQNPLGIPENVLELACND